MPPIKEDLIDPQKVSFQPNEARKSLFAGKLFLFMEENQVIEPAYLPEIQRETRESVN